MSKEIRLIRFEWAIKDILRNKASYYVLDDETISIKTDLSIEEVRGLR